MQRNNSAITPSYYFRPFNQGLDVSRNGRAEGCGYPRAIPSPNNSLELFFRRLSCSPTHHGGHHMGLGKGALLWLIGIPIPIIIALMFFLR
jgi:hypothetical protein